MRSYNASAAEGEDIRFYGFDMEQHAYSYRYLLEELKKADIDTSGFEKIWDGEKNAYSDLYTSAERAETIRAIMEKLPANESKARHYADVLLQNIELGKYINDVGELNEQRDRMMAENTDVYKRQVLRRSGRQIPLCASAGGADLCALRRGSGRVPAPVSYTHLAV